jgi:hypothetical protein
MYAFYSMIASADDALTRLKAEREAQKIVQKGRYFAFHEFPPSSFAN